MRALFLRAFVALCVLSVPIAVISAPANAQNQQQATIAAILAQYPDGGQGLADAIAAAVEADPSLAQAAVTAALTANPAQQQAIGTGLAEAATFFANSSSPGARTAQQQLQAAMASAPASTLTAFNAGGGAAALLSLLGGGGGTGLTTSNCVSPNRPGAGC